MFSSDCGVGAGYHWPSVECEDIVCSVDEYSVDESERGIKRDFSEGYSEIQSGKMIRSVNSRGSLSCKERE